MTALVSLETIDQSQIAIVPLEALVGENPSIKGLSEGEVISTSSLLYPLLLESSNAAAKTLAGHIGTKNFVNYMNGKAGSIGLSDTFLPIPAACLSETPPPRKICLNSFLIFSITKGKY